MVQDFQNMQVWQDAVSFHKDIISEIASFPKEELYAMSSQLRRVSLSISNNIAEGCGRNSNKELKNFLSIAMGSCKEVESMIVVAKELSYINNETFTTLIQKIIIIGKKLNSLMQKVSEQVNMSMQNKSRSTERNIGIPKTKNQLLPTAKPSFAHQQPTTKNQQHQRSWFSKCTIT